MTNPSNTFACPNRSFIFFALAVALAGCAMTPAQASDARPPGWKDSRAAGQSYKLSPGDNLGYEAAPVPPILGGASSDRLFDDPAAGKFASRVVWVRGVGAIASWSPPGLTGSSRNGGNNNGGNLQNSGNGGGNSGCGNGNGGPDGGKDCDKPPKPPQPDVPGVPGPVPLLGVAAAFGWSRRLRRRVQP